MSCDARRQLRVFEINKYTPRAFRAASPRFGGDWISCDAIVDGRISREQYLAVEDRYVRAVLRLCDRFGAVTAHGLERWEEHDDLLSSIGLDDVFIDIAAPAPGKPLDRRTIENVARRCLREAAWLELVARPDLIIHFGWDLRLLVAVSQDVGQLLVDVRSDGLFVYPSRAQLNTLQEWAAD